MLQELLLANILKLTKKSPLEKPSLFVLNVIGIMEKKDLLAVTNNCDQNP